MKAFAPQLVVIVLTAVGCGGSTAPSVSSDQTAATTAASGPVVAVQVRPFRATDALPQDPVTRLKLSPADADRILEKRLSGLGIWK